MELHQSTLNTAQTCLKKYKYRYLEGLEREEEVNQTLLLGTATHKALEWYYQDYPNTNPLDYLDKLRRRYRRLSEENKEILEGMLRSYGIYSRANDPDLIGEVIATEYDFEVTVVNIDEEPTEHTLAGTVDLVFRDTEGNLCLADHKTRTRLMDDKDYLSIDNQLLMYSYALSREFDEKVEKFYYNTILKKSPSEPRVLKSGKLSKSKRIRSLPSIVIKAIKDHHDGSVPVDYRGLISSQFDKMDKKGNPFVDRIEVEHTMDQLINFEEDIYLKIKELSEREYFPAQPGKYKCKYCSYLQICISDSKNGDKEFLKSFFK